MANKSLHLVPNDSLIPHPVTPGHLEESLHRLNHTVRRGPTDLLHVSADSTDLRVLLHGDGSHICVETQWNTDLPFEEVELSLFAAADSWNRDSPFPTIFTAKDASGGAVIVASFNHVCGAGLTDEQTDHVLETGIKSCIRAAKYMISVTHTILQMPPSADE